MSITIKRARQTVTLCTNLALVADHEQAVSALRRAEENPSGLEIDAARLEAARAVQEAERKMLAESITFTLAALPRRDFANLKAKWPPRAGDATDKAIGFSQEGLDDLLIECIVEVRDADGELVEFNPEADWRPLADEMSQAQFDPFATAAVLLNAGVGDVPFSRSASLLIRRSERNSNSPSD